MTNRWVAGARPRTLPAAVVPVAVGTGVAAASRQVVVWRAGAALAVALAIQIATNYANDYSDGIRGTDDVRAGPVRLVASKLASPTAVRRAAWLSFAVAGLVGLTLAAATSWWLVPVGVACVAAGWLYTGGPRPYGYIGLGEVFVFVFFGLVAVVATAFVQTEQITALAVAAAIPIGLLSCAMLVVNNLRDIPGDTGAGKRTLAVRLGDARTRALYVVLLGAAVALVLFPAISRRAALLTLAATPLAVRPIQAVRHGAVARDLVPVLQDTARFLLAFGVLLAIGLAL